MHPSNELKNIRRRVDRARRTFENTCPASRHVHTMADALSMWGGYPMLGEEPEHCALSMYSVLESLWKARTELAKLKGTEAADEIERLRTAVFAAATAAGRERLAAQNARHIALEEAAAVCDGLQSGPQCATAIRALSAVEKGGLNDRPKRR